MLKLRQIIWAKRQTDTNVFLCNFEISFTLLGKIIKQINVQVNKCFLKSLYDTIAYNFVSCETGLLDLLEEMIICLSLGQLGL